MRLRWFKDDRGSTTLGVVLAIVLVLALMASCLQWYWTNSSSADIQTVADLGALSAADAGAKAVMFIQVLDALLLTANLFGLLLHCVVIVSGVLSVVSSPVGGAGATAFFEKAVEFDRSFCEKRREFAQDVYKLATALCEATPYVSLAQSYRTVAANGEALRGFNDAQYVTLTVPFPLRGELELTGFPADEQKLLDEVEKTNEAGAQAATELQELEREVERGLDECFRLDIYKPVTTTRAYWNPAQAFTDFKRGFRELAAQDPTVPTTPVPIEDTARNRAKLAENFRECYRELTADLSRRVPEDIGSAASGSAHYDARDLSPATYLGSVRSSGVWLLEHADGQRRAYHRLATCFGLAGSKHELQWVALSTVEGDNDHPPCVLCAPTHWRAVQAWADKLGGFTQDWNKEAAALRAYERAREQLQEGQKKLKADTGQALADVAEQAKGWLAGGRLRYRPAGARGYLCVVATTNERALPDFTLPALTASGGVRLGRQIAISAARLMPSKQASTLPGFLDESLSATHPGSSTGGQGLGAALSKLLAFAGSGGSFILRLWGSCLDVYTKGSTGLSSLLSGLPWGLDAVFAPALKKLLSAAELTPPDLRRPQATLVNTADIGDAAAGGLEGSLVAALGQGKQALRSYLSVSPHGLQASLSAALDELCANFNQQIERLTTLKLLGVTIELPFSEAIRRYCDEALAALRGREHDLLAGLGQATR